MSGVPTIITRQAWQARTPRHRYTMRLPTPSLYIHHLAAEWHGLQGVREAQDFHMDVRGWSDIAYSFLVDDDGMIYEGRGPGVVGGHTEGQNSSSHAICAMGNFDKRQPTQAMLNSIADLARYGREEGWWGQITGGHRNAPRASTACPGNYLYAQIPTIRAMAESDALPVSSEDDEMPAPEKITAALAYRGGIVLLQWDGGTRFIERPGGWTDGVAWPFDGPFSVPGLSDDQRQIPDGFVDIVKNDRGGFDIIHELGAVFSYPVA